MMGEKIDLCEMKWRDVISKKNVITAFNLKKAFNTAHFTFTYSYL